ncbi:YjeF-related protein N-terminus-domain-containing protein [Coniella lustricola]|uniref:Enhancer of mRNA-decapping protein 3 n=1 Tax=Coniella lustricola TaxID=2025994 RepID=A0A2T3AK76_9PEZI|nr:YjeF-related protein N-terminus-domain-containing protein [Coniella lustricola]
MQGLGLGLGSDTRAESAEQLVEAEGPAELDDQEQEQQSPQKKTRRRNRTAKKNTNELLDPEAASSAGSKPSKKGKGWRETPMLEDTSQFQPYKALRKTKINQDGWASEDVTDVQEMPDFDFEGSLRKFDKRTIFDEMKEKDQVEEADRLVSHNRKPKPGTAGGKNLHYTENVLEPPTLLEKPNKAPPDDFWKSEADDGAVNGSERLSGREHAMGSRQSSRRGEGKAVGKARSQSRKASAANVAQAPSRTNSGLPSGAPANAGFVVAPTNRRVEILSPLQMLNLENIAQNDLGLTEDMMTENAARGITEVALHTLTDPAIRVRLAAADGSAAEQPATVVILAGNNKSGYRSVAAGRHLRNKGLNVILCVVGIEKGERDLSVDMTKQLRLFKNFGGKVCSKAELFDFVRKASMPVISMDAPRSVLPQAPPMAVTLIIDALLGHVTPFEDLRASEQATVYELIEWTNRNEAFVLAVDVPTGIDHTTGQPTVQDGHNLYIRPRYVVSIGAPKKGLFEAIAAGAGEDDDTVTGRATDDIVLDWNLYLIDIGLGAAVWKRAGTKMRKGIDFGNKWALQFKYQSSDADQAEE